MNLIFDDANVFRDHSLSMGRGAQILFLELAKKKCPPSKMSTVLSKTSISRDMGSATKAALILNRSVVQFRILGRPTDLSKSFLVIRL